MNCYEEPKKKAARLPKADMHWESQTRILVHGALFMFIVCILSLEYSNYW